MARASLRRFDVQAKVSLYISCIAVLCMVALAFLLLRNFEREMRVVVYGGGSLFAPVVLGVTALTLLLGAVGAAMGANSAGQRRNNLSKRSWAGFLLGCATVSATIILFAMFWFNRIAMR